MGTTAGLLVAGAALLMEVRRLRVIAAFLPAARRFRVVAAFIAAVRRFQVTAAFRAADVPIGQLLRSRDYVLIPRILTLIPAVPQPRAAKGECGNCESEYRSEPHDCSRNALELHRHVAAALLLSAFAKTSDASTCDDMRRRARGCAPAESRHGHGRSGPAACSAASAVGPDR